MGDFLADRLSRYKHPESFEIVSVGLRDDSGKVRRTLLRDERAAWLKENRAFRIMPARARGEGGLRRRGSSYPVENAVAGVSQNADIIGGIWSRETLKMRRSAT